ncbi:pilus assembly protein CpaE [Desulfitispora alkaliphila]|uniref:response regulator n=1 Tax=Desulfitispora alkaliphila TaxID=622674 RepID=UPI003D1EB883
MVIDMPEKIRVLIVNDNKYMRDSIKELLFSAKEFKLTGEAENGKDAVDLTISFQPDIVLMDINMPIMDGFDATLKISQVAPYIGVILIGTVQSDELLRRSMQSGAGDFLEIPFSKAKLQNAILSLYAIKREQRKQITQNPLIIPNRQTNIISVLSSKGGVGKTILATNMAVSLKKQTREDVLLMDLDLQFGDIAEVLDIPAKKSIVNLIKDKDNIDISELEKYLLTHRSGIKILAAPMKPEQADLISGQDVADIILLFSRIFDYIVIDLPPLFNEVVMTSLDKSNHLLMVTTMEIPSIKNLKSGIDVLKRLKYPQENVTLILNRYNEGWHLKFKDVTEYFGLKDIVCISDNPEVVSMSINSGEPLVTMYKNTKIAEQINDISKQFIEYKARKHSKSNFLEYFRRKVGKRE